MKRSDAEKIVTEYLKPVFGFALRRCRSDQDAEDLSQEIVLRAYRAFLLRDDVEDPGRFIWTVAHNALANYYRDRSKSVIGVSVDEIAETLADPTDCFSDGEDGQAVKRLQSEIAYLSKTRRRIVIAYYYENKKQTDIAVSLGLPLGTVKWHLFEAKKELKRGMEKMRESNELKFNPIKFGTVWINGRPGSKPPSELFRTVLSQNICYDVRNEPKTVARIADDLGVSPVYVEEEVDYLEGYGLLEKKGDGYVVNFIINELTEEYLSIQDGTYKKAAALYADELFDELTESGILDDPGIICGSGDRNFVLWSLIPFIAARSGKDIMEERIRFEEVATIRPDGGHNIVSADVTPADLVLPDGIAGMKNWSGPMYVGRGGKSLWQIYTEWSDRETVLGKKFFDEAGRVLSLLLCEETGPLSKHDYAWLAERGYVRMIDDPDGNIRASWQIVMLEKEVRDRLLALGGKIKAAHREEFEAIAAPFKEAALRIVPAHMRRAKEYELQFVFHSDGLFLFHCIRTLIESGKLRLPEEEQKKALTALIFPE